MEHDCTVLVQTVNNMSISVSGQIQIFTADYSDHKKQYLAKILPDIATTLDKN